MNRQEIIDGWNAQADEYNQWDDLGEDEKLEWAMQMEREACAKACDDAIASIWEYSPEDVKQVGKNVCNNLAAAIRARGQQ